jgi:hypothetical protein
MTRHMQCLENDFYLGAAGSYDCVFTRSFFGIWLIWVLTYHNLYKNIVKILHNNDMVEV